MGVSQPEYLGVAEASTDDIYATMDWLVHSEHAIEAVLARRHLGPGANPARWALFDLSSSWLEGRCCPLAARRPRYSPARAQAKASYQRPGRPYLSFHSLLEQLATLPRNQVRFTGSQVTVPMLTEPTSTQRKASSPPSSPDLDVARTPHGQSGEMPVQAPNRQPSWTQLPSS